MLHAAPCFILLSDRFAQRVQNAPQGRRPVGVHYVCIEESMGTNTHNRVKQSCNSKEIICVHATEVHGIVNCFICTYGLLSNMRDPPDKQRVKKRHNQRYPATMQL